MNRGPQPLRRRSGEAGSQEEALYDFYLNALKGLDQISRLQLWDEDTEMFTYDAMHKWSKEMISLFVRLSNACYL